MKKILITVFIFTNLNTFSQSITKIESSNIQTNSFELSILKYKDKVVDVQTIGYCHFVVFKINKSLLLPEHALDLIGNYYWKMIGNNLEKEYDMNRYGIFLGIYDIYYKEPDYIIIKNERFIYQLN